MSGITFRYSTPDGIEAPVLLWRKGKRHGPSNRGKEKTCSPCPFKTGPTANQLFGFHTMVACQVKKMSFVFHTIKNYINCIFNWLPTWRPHCTVDLPFSPRGCRSAVGQAQLYTGRYAEIGLKDRNFQASKLEGGVFGNQIGSKGHKQVGMDF